MKATYKHADREEMQREVRKAMIGKTVRNVMRDDDAVWWVYFTDGTFVTFERPPMVGVSQ